MIDIVIINIFGRIRTCRVKHEYGSGLDIRKIKRSVRPVGTAVKGLPYNKLGDNGRGEKNDGMGVDRDAVSPFVLYQVVYLLCDFLFH